MPRAKKTLSPETASMEAGAAYGEVSDNIEAQRDVPLPDNRMPDNQMAGGSAPLPMEQAQDFKPQVTPLLAPGQNIPTPQMVQPLTVQQRTANMLRGWADATGDPLIADAAAQLEGQ
tara:strand:+ start:4094 stop:4444 length:351 start_codon:yes stop_codon:yes gene_type:complete